MKRLISYLLILTVLASSLLIALPVHAASVEDCVAPSASNSGECHAPVLVETEEYPAVKNGGNYIYDVEDLYSLFRDPEKYPEYPNGLAGDGGYETYIIQNDIILDSTYNDNDGLGGNFSYATVDGKNTDGRVCTVHFNDGKALFGWGRDVTIKNLLLDGYSLYDDPSYDQHISPLVMHGIDYDCVLENITSRVNITVTAWADHSSTSIDQKIGGVITKVDGGNDDYFTNVVFEGSITIGTPENPVPLYGPIGGIAGTGSANSSATLYMTECHNKGKITINGDTNGMAVGGLIGRTVSHVEAVNCTNSGSIELTRDYSSTAIGGILGWGYRTTAPSEGQTYSMSFTNCHNTGNISATGAWKTDIVDGAEEYVYEDVTVEGVTTREQSFITNVSMGGIVGEINSLDNNPATTKITKCSNEGNLINVYGKVVNIGGILGASSRENLTIEYCTNGAKGTATGSITTRNLLYDNDTGGHCGVGGILGNASNPGTLAYKANPDSTTASPDGYIVEVSNTGLKININNCVNYGKMSLSDVGKNLNGGGIIGRIHAAPEVTISRCLNYGVVDLSKSTEWSGAGGIIGAFMTVAFPTWNPTYEGTTVNRHDETGATVYDTDGTTALTDNGRFEFSWSNLDHSNFTMSYCYNFSGANVTGGVHAGGILGGGQQLNDNDIKINISYCTNEATVTAGQNGGGIVGMLGEQYQGTNELFGTLDFTYCANKGAVTVNNTFNASNYAAGGILGVMWGDSESEIYNQVGTADDDNKDVERTSFTNCSNSAIISINQGTGVYIGEIAGRVNNIALLNATMIPGERYLNGTSLGGTTGTGYSNQWIGSGYDGGTGNDSVASTADSYFNTAQSKTGLISNEEQFYAAFRHDVGATGAYYITADFSLTKLYDQETKNAGYDATRLATQFQNGVIYGNGHTIKLEGSAEFLFFQILKGDNAIYDLNVEGTVTSSATHCSPLTRHGSAGSLILSNITSSVTINHSGFGACGGIATKLTHDANQQVILEDLTFSGKINRTSTLSNTDGYGGVGGIVANTFDGTMMVNCKTTDTSSITVAGGSANLLGGGVGGLIGFFTYDLEMLDCENNANITVSDGTNLHVGGLVGNGVNRSDAKYGSISISNCHNLASTVNGGQYVGGLFGGFAYQPTAGSAALELVSSTNKANVTGASAAGGLIGSTLPCDAVLTLDTKCANIGTVQATAGYAGGIIGQAQAVKLTNIANTGNVSGTTGAGGLIGYASVSVAVDNCVNRGDVTAENNAGGILSNAAGTISLNKTANGGAVTSTATSGTTVTAAGIVAYIGTATSVSINNCVNSGAVKVMSTAASTTDTAITAGGILGISASAAVVNNSINMGKIATGGATPSNSAYPIANPSDTVTTTAARTLGNIYREGTVDEANADNYTLSTKATDSQVKALIGEFWAFDMDSMAAQCAIAEEGKTDGLYVGDQETALDARLTDSYATISADWTEPNNWVYQSTVNTEDDLLVSAMATFTSSAGYIVYIPEIINPDTSAELTVTSKEFNIYSEMSVTFRSDLTLDNTATPDDKLTYEVSIDGETRATDYVISTISGKDNKTETYTILATVTPTEGQNVYVAGIYKDTVSFVIDYTEVPKESYAD